MTNEQIKFSAFAIIMTFIVGSFVTNMMEKNRLFYEHEVDKLMEQNAELQKDLDEFREYGIKVTVTMYRPTEAETDATPDITAAGTRIRIKKASDYKFVAVSRNLLKRWGGILDFGDFIL